MRLATIAALILALLLLAPQTASAKDRVHLKTGGVLEGKIVRELEDKIMMEIPGLGLVGVARERIARIEKEGEPPTKRPVPGPKPEPGPEPRPEPGTEPEPKPTPAKPPIEPQRNPVTPKEPVKKKDSIRIAYDDLEAGQQVLVLAVPSTHTGWTNSGRRIVGEVSVAGPKRIKVVFDPTAGVLGTAWLKKEEIDRVIRMEGHPERRILFFDDVPIGSWLDARARGQGKFAGRLAGVTANGRVTVEIPDGESTGGIEFGVDDLLELSATVRGRPLEERLESLVPGEPMALRIRNRKHDLRGRFVSRAEHHLQMEVADGTDGEVKMVAVFIGLPITDLVTLPDGLRARFQGLSRGEHLTVLTIEESEKTRTSQSRTGTLVHATLDEISLLTADGAVTMKVANVHELSRPPADRIPLLMKGKEESEAETALPVRPGMTRQEAERRLPADLQGVDVVYDGDRVKRIYCRSPYRGPVFGIVIGSDLSNVLDATDLLFETQVDPKDEGSTSFTLLYSRTLRGRTVKLFVSPAGQVLALELSAR